MIYLHWCGKLWHYGCFMFLWDTPQEFVCDAWVCEKCASSIPVAIMLGCSVIDDYVGCFKVATSDYSQEIKSLGGCLMWNDAFVCGGMVWFIFFVRIWSDMWKSLKRNSEMIFSVPLMWCKYMDVLLLTRVQPRQRDMELCASAFTGSKYAFCIHHSELELYVNTRMC